MAKINFTPEMETLCSEIYVPVREEPEAVRTAAVKRLVEIFRTDARFADNGGKSEASVRGKLSRMKVYVPAAKPRSKVTGLQANMSKEDIVEKASEVSGMPLVGLEKANKDTCAKILTAFQVAAETAATLDEYITEFGPLPVADDESETGEDSGEAEAEVEAS